MDAEIEGIQGLPDLESDIYVYLEELARQSRLCAEVLTYCNENGNLEDVKVHL